MSDARIMLHSGNMFDILEPHTTEFTLHDIAHGLGRICRFAGQTNRFYSVAEHSVNVARGVPIHIGRAALLHDASEAFIGDVTRPLKQLLPRYKEIEATITNEVFARFLPDVDPENLAPDIKAADEVMLIVESCKLMSEYDGHWLREKERVKATYPIEWDRMKKWSLSFDRPEFATDCWLRAWQMYSHAEANIKNELDI